MIVLDLDINYQIFNIVDIKSKNKYVQGVDISLLNPGGLSLIIETESPELQIHFDFRSGVLHLDKTKLGWALLGRKSIRSN